MARRDRESDGEVIAQLEDAEANADEWVARIERQGHSEVLLGSPPPDRFTLATMAGRARGLVESSPDLADAIARALLSFAEAVPGSPRSRDELASSAWLVLASIRRRRGALDDAEELLRRIRARFPGGHPDPLAEAELIEEEAELFAARGRYREAIERARAALREYSDPNLQPRMRAALLRKISFWARADSSRG